MGSERLARENADEQREKGGERILPLILGKTCLQCPENKKVEGLTEVGI